MNSSEEHLSEIGEGWHSLARPIISYAQNKNMRIAQIKEKFGALRIYVDDADDYLNAMIERAEEASIKICEECGAPGKRRPGGWVKTLCDTHASERGKDA